LKFGFSARGLPLSLCLFLVLTLLPSNSSSSACCGGGIVFPSVIVGDQKSQLMLIYSYTEVVINNVDNNGIWYRWPNRPAVQVMRLDAAHIISDRWQVGASLPVIDRSFLDKSYSGVGDLSTTISYEYLPEWGYHQFRPKGIAFFQVILPTGRSSAESQVGGMDSRGNGFLALGAGTILTKAWSNWDSFFMTQVHHSFARELSNPSLKGRLVPGLGGTVSIGLGFTKKKVRVGTGIVWSYEDPIDLNLVTGNSIPGKVERFATGMISASYFIDSSWMATLSYLDQTWFGSPINTSLGQGIMFQLVKSTLR